MKTKLLYGALFLAGFGAGALPSRLLGRGSEATTLEVQNTRLYVTRAPLSDGGRSSDVIHETCGYLRSGDGGLVSEPCWRGELEAKDVQMLFKRLLSDYDAGR